MFLRWKFSGPHFMNIPSHRARHHGVQFRVALYKTRPEFFKNPHQIVKNKHLPVAVRPRTDPDHGYPEFRGDPAGHFPGDAFKKHGKSALALKRLGCLQDPDRAFRVLALDSKPVFLLRGLRGQADMAHDGYFMPNKKFCHPKRVWPPFELDSIAPRLTDKTFCRAERLPGTLLNALKRNVADNERPFCSASDRFGVMDHFIHRDGGRGGVA